jgi:hypothetical protein
VCKLAPKKPSSGGPVNEDTIRSSKRSRKKKTKTEKYRAVVVALAWQTLSAESQEALVGHVFSKLYGPWRNARAAAVARFQSEGRFESIVHKTGVSLDKHEGNMRMDVADVNVSDESITPS